MKRTTLGIAARTVAAFALLILVGAAAVIFTGAYNVAASVPHFAVTRWVMRTAMERSVAVRADEIPAPPHADSTAVRRGFEEYNAMCVDCHAAPGVERNAFGEGMTPEPPDLAEAASKWSDRELFWITKHGIKVAGMPAFGRTHSDEELWGIVAFIRRLEHMSPDAYRRLAVDAGTHGHDETREPMRHTSSGGVATPLASESHTPAEHARSAPGSRSPAATRHPRTPGMPHAGMPATEHARSDSGSLELSATEKLTLLAAELLRDPAVAARVRADSQLRRRWEDSSVRRLLTKPPR